MGLREVMHLPTNQAIKLGRMQARYIRLMQDPMARFTFEAMFLKRDIREERKKLDELYVTRSWALTEGVLKNHWVACAAGHDSYSENPEQDEWRQETLVGRTVWVCSAQCGQKWRLENIKKLDTENARKVEITYESGKKSIIQTTGQTLYGPELGHTEEYRHAKQPERSPEAV